MKKTLFYGLTAALILAAILSGCGGTPPGPEPISIAESLVPGGAGLDVTYPYYMAQTEVTYQTWAAVRDWALAHGYNFANEGGRGGYWDLETHTEGTYASGHETDPVTEISWRDAIVWCNALTEYYNAHHGTDYECAYMTTSDGKPAPIRDSDNSDVCDDLTDDGHTASGFRLPTAAEWYLAASYIDGTNWTPENYASGATGPYTNDEATQAVAWYWDNSTDPDDSNIKAAHPVGQKDANALGIFDMSGNVHELCFELLESSGGGRKVRGGNWQSPAENMQIGIDNTFNYPDEYNVCLGFRPVRTCFD